MRDSLGDRMKKLYEDPFRNHLPGRMPVILRCDGCHFSTYTKDCKKPVDENLVNVMNDTAKYLCEHIQGAQIAFIQSDEISILLNSYKTIDTQSWFENNIQKMCSVAAGMASSYFSINSHKIFGEPRLAVFDCRTFVLPKEEVNNALLWRQQDTIRNSVQSLARSVFSQKECHNKNNEQLKDMLLKKGISWEDLPTSQKRGRCIVKIKTQKIVSDQKTGEFIVDRSEWIVDNEIPIFSEDKNYIEKYVI